MKKTVWNHEKWIKVGNRYALLWHLTGSVALYFLMELMSRHSLLETVRYLAERPLAFFYNVGILFMTLSLAFLFRRRFFVRLVVGLFWFALGAVNGILLLSRVTPFTGQDLKLLSDAKKIMNNYLSPVLFFGIILILLATLVFLVWFWFKGPLYQGNRRMAAGLAVTSVSVLLFIGATIGGLRIRILSGYFGNIATAYEDYGLPYCFFVTLLDTGISQPNGYSEELMSYVEQTYADLPGTEPGEGKKPNVIFLQLESFFDPTTVRYLDISEDPIPNYHSLQKEFSSGMLTVPVVGAGTVNTEFEVITGMSLAYFGAGEYPYKTILKDSTCESIPFDLRELGYETHAIHNNEANFYSRRNVYSMLGFDTFISEEYMPNVSDVTETGWIKDHILTDEIMKCLEKSEGPDYVYTVSVQGHGDYPTEPTVEDPEIRVTGAENRDKNDDSWEYYVKQLHEMDAFVREVTDRLVAHPEPVILVMYGDHLPSLGLGQSDVKGWDLYRTPYIIWDNMGLKRKTDNYTTYQIGAEALKRVGIHEGTLVRFHQKRKGSRFYRNDLEVLQYDMLYGKQYVYGGRSPFEPTDLQLGIEPARIERIRVDTSESFAVYGENFTAASRVEINGELQENTIYVAPNLLLVQGYDLRNTDRIDVATQSASSTKKVLTRTRELPVAMIKSN